MRRSLLASVALAALTACLGVYADEPTKGGGSKVNPPITEGKDGKPVLDQATMAAKQKELAEKFSAFEKQLVTLQQRLANGSDKDREKAAQLKKVLDTVSDREPSKKFTQLVKALTDTKIDNNIESAQLVAKAAALAKDLKEILDLLKNADGTLDRKAERLAMEQLLKKLNGVIRDEKIIRQKINTPDNDHKDIATDQADNTANAKKLEGQLGKDGKPGNGGEAKDNKGTAKEGGKGDKADGKATNKDGEGSKSGDSKDAGKGDGKKGGSKDAGKGDGSKSGADGKGEAKNSKGGDGSKSGGSKDGQGGGKEAGKDKQGGEGSKDAGASKDAGKKDGAAGAKGGDDKKGDQAGAKKGGDAGEAGKAGDKKAGEGSKSDSSAKGGGDPKGDGKGGEAKSGDGKASGSSKSGGQQAGDPQAGGGKGDNSPPPPGNNNPKDDLGNTKKKIQEAIENMKKAEDEIAKANRPGADKEADEAIKKLEEAKKKLEDLIRQLREEELERVLAALINRCQKMLQMQIDVLTGTLKVDGQIATRPNKKADREDTQASINLADDEDKIVQEATKAIEMLEAEGSAIAFPEVFQQLREDMKHVHRRLKITDVGDVTQTIEQDIIETLRDMIKALEKAKKEMDDKKNPPKPPSDQPPPPPQDQKLLDKIAELKMLKAMQMRVNGRTDLYSKMYKGEQATDPAIQSELRDIAGRQERIFEVANKLARGDNQ
jgi:hypothetical protein